MNHKGLSRIEIIRKLNENPEWVNEGLYRILYNPDVYQKAYQRIKSKPGNMTPGIDESTLDGFSNETISEVIAKLRDESYQFSKGRRIYIPKANGKKRPLTIAPPREKVVQEAIRIILEAIYEKSFSELSHGFRPERGTHTALKEIRKWHGTSWFIEGDIKGCFDNIDHGKLVEILEERINDQRFLKLIRKALKAGYMIGNTSQNTISGTPQGSIISPILTNIYLDKLDKLVEGLIEEYNQGERRAWNSEYRRLARERGKLKEAGDLEGAKEKLKLMRQTSSFDTNDPNYIRVKYCRYADDWIIGVVGPRQVAIEIRDRIKDFLLSELKLELSLGKTHIRHARTEQALFLGTLISTQGGKEPKIAKLDNSKIKKRVTGWLIVMNAPIPEIISRLHKAGFCDRDGNPTQKKGWLNLEHHEILNLANSVIRGYRNYYSFVNNYSKLNRIEYIIRFSVAKTLNSKYRLGSLKRTFAKFGKHLATEVETKNGKKKVVKLDLTTKWVTKTNRFRCGQNVGDISALYITKTTHSPLDKPCIICGSIENIEMHHVRHIRKIGQNVKGFTRIMAELNRKQIPVCKGCHRKIHTGKYDGIALKDLQYD